MLQLYLSIYLYIYQSIYQFIYYKQLFYLFYIFFCRFTILVCGEKNIFPRSRSRVFLAPWSRSRSKKNTRSRSRLKKKSGAGAAKKFAGSPALPETNPIIGPEGPSNHKTCFWILEGFFYETPCIFSTIFTRNYFFKK